MLRRFKKLKLDKHIVWFIDCFKQNMERQSCLRCWVLAEVITLIRQVLHLCFSVTVIQQVWTQHHQMESKALTTLSVLGYGTFLLALNFQMATAFDTLKVIWMIHGDVHHNIMRENHQTGPGLLTIMVCGKLPFKGHPEYELVKAVTHWPKRWTSEALGETWTRLGTNLFGVLEALGAAWTLSAPIQHAKSWGGWLSAIWAIGLGLVVYQRYDHSDWQCASESARCVGGAEYCVHFAFLCTPFRHFLFSCSVTRLLHLVQAQNVNAAVELAAR